MNTNEGNTLIAHYLEWFQEKDQPYTWYKIDSFAQVVAYSTYKDMFKELPFHKDWNYLVPVVRSIMQQLHEIERLLDSQDDERCRDYEAEIDRMNEAITALDIELLWTDTVEAIIVINKLTKDGSNT